MGEFNTKVVHLSKNGYSHLKIIYNGTDDSPLPNRLMLVEKNIGSDTFSQKYFEATKSEDSKVEFDVFCRYTGSLTIHMNFVSDETPEDVEELTCKLFGELAGDIHVLDKQRPNEVVKFRIKSGPDDDRILHMTSSGPASVVPRFEVKGAGQNPAATLSDEQADGTEVYHHYVTLKPAALNSITVGPTSGRTGIATLIHESDFINTTTLGTLLLIDSALTNEDVPPPTVVRSEFISSRGSAEVIIPRMASANIAAAFLIIRKSQTINDALTNNFMTYSCVGMTRDTSEETRVKIPPYHLPINVTNLLKVFDLTIQIALVDNDGNVLLSPATNMPVSVALADLIMPPPGGSLPAPTLNNLPQGATVTLNNLGGISPIRAPLSVKQILEVAPDTQAVFAFIRVYAAMPVGGAGRVALVHAQFTIADSSPQETLMTATFDPNRLRDFESFADGKLGSMMIHYMLYPLRSNAPFSATSSYNIDTWS